MNYTPETYRKKPLIFIGPRACGKSTLAHTVAERMGLKFYDTDAIIQDNINMSIANFVDTHGWTAFRAQETLALRSVCTEHAVIATGGGCILAKENRALMRTNGIVCFLDAPAHVLIQRLRQHPNTSMRPALTQATLVHEVRLTLKKRRPLYQHTAHKRMDAQLPLPYLITYIYKMLMQRRHSLNT